MLLLVPNLGNIALFALIFATSPFLADLLEVGNSVTNRDLGPPTSQFIENVSSGNATMRVQELVQSGVQLIGNLVAPCSRNKSIPSRAPFSFETLECRQLMAVTTDAGGWTVVTPSSDSRVIYVSSSEGNDQNDGLSESAPKKTLAAGLALMRNGFPDQLLLKSGDVWTNEQIVGGNGSFGQGGRSADEPMLFSSYGEGARPKLVNSDLEPVRLVGTRSNIYVIGLHLDGSIRDSTDNPGGINVIGRGENLHFEDNLIDGFGTNLIVNRATSSDTWDDVSIRRNVIVNSWNTSAHSQGIYANAVHGLLIEENTLDHNGWNDAIGDEPSGFNHNMYLSHSNLDVVIRDNFSSRGSSAGLKFQPTAGVHYVSGNVFTQNDFGMTVGGGVPQEVPPITGAEYHVTNNVVVENTTKVTPSGAYGVLVTNVNGGEFSNNIIANKQADNPGWALSIMDGRNSWETRGYGVRDFEVSDNVIYNWRGQVQVKEPTTTDPYTGEISNVRFENNAIQEPSLTNDQPLIQLDAFAADNGVISFTGNKYYSKQAANEWFKLDTTSVDLATWQATKGDAGATNSRVDYVDPTRTVTTYAASLGYTTYEAFISAAKFQSKANWDVRFTAQTIGDYIRDGYQLDTVGVTPLPSPSAPTSSAFAPLPAFAFTAPMQSLMVAGDSTRVESSIVQQDSQPMMVSHQTAFSQLQQRVRLSSLMGGSTTNSDCAETKTDESASDAWNAAFDNWDGGLAGDYSPGG
ncbi:hypothetical protein [Aeoliella sp.]|uniref:hypothetical protein n=1 Tax=Aeoliella sp. TaxID=2795800 RepID=UPI003CCBB4C6